MENLKIRCPWAGSDPLYIAYHDKEWGVCVHDEQKLFEMLILEGAQAGLSWSTILKKRENYRLAFDGFDFFKIAKYKTNKIESLLTNEGIIRNKLKIHTAVQNANAFIKIREEFGSFDKYIWKFVGNKPIKHAYFDVTEYTAKSVESEHMSQELRKRGFNFVGPTICYSFMQACGLVNDHITPCFRYNEV
jgi:DNA-3-methyladenine glycosylase I